MRNRLQMRDAFLKAGPPSLGFGEAFASNGATRIAIPEGGERTTLYVSTGATRFAIPEGGQRKRRASRSPKGESPNPKSAGVVATCNRR
jgi:hypothetical protein